MSRRVLLIGWFLVAALVWNVIFDLHVSLGTRDFLFLVAEAEAGRHDPPGLAGTMRWWQRRGAMVATASGAVVLGAAYVTVLLANRRPAKVAGT